MTKRILGMRPWLFRGAAIALLLILAGYFAARPLRRLQGAIRRNRRTARTAQSRRQLAETPEGANSVTMGLIAKGNALARKYRFQEAITYYRQALEIARKFNLRPRAQAGLEMIGNAFDELRMADSAAIYYQKAQELAEADTSRRAVILGYWNRGVSLIRDPETNDSAQTLIRRALALAEAAHDTPDLGQITYNLGMCFLYGFKPDSCLKYLRKYAELEHHQVSGKWNATVAFNAGFAFCQQKEWDSAYRNFASALEYNSRLRNKTDIWLLQQDLDSVREWGSIPPSEADRARKRVPQPHGVTLDFNMYLMGRYGRPMPSMWEGTFEGPADDTGD